MKNPAVAIWQVIRDALPPETYAPNNSVNRIIHALTGAGYIINQAPDDRVVPHGAPPPWTLAERTAQAERLTRDCYDLGERNKNQEATIEAQKKNLLDLRERLNRHGQDHMKDAATIERHVDALRNEQNTSAALRETCGDYCDAVDQLEERHDDAMEKNRALQKNIRNQDDALRGLREKHRNQGNTIAKLLAEREGSRDTKPKSSVISRIHNLEEQLVVVNKNLARHETQFEDQLRFHAIYLTGEKRIDWNQHYKDTLARLVGGGQG